MIDHIVFCTYQNHHFVKKYNLHLRSNPLIKFIDSYCLEETTVISFFDDMPEIIKEKSNVLIFFNLLNLNFQEVLSSILWIEDNRPNWKIVILDISDEILMFNEFQKYAYVEVSGTRIKPFHVSFFDGTEVDFPPTIDLNRISGFGWINPRPFNHNLKLASQTPWSDRKNDFVFYGTINSKTRVQFLKKVKKTGFKTNINVSIPTHFDFASQCHFSDIAGSFDCLTESFLLSNLNYLIELSSHKYCLAPNGTTHTHRILEGMAMGCLVISQSLSDVKFIVNPFEEGVTHFDVGCNCEKLEEVINKCVNSCEEKIKEIADNGHRVYKEFFQLDKFGALPFNTAIPLLKEIEKITGVNFKITQSSIAHS